MGVTVLCRMITCRIETGTFSILNVKTTPVLGKLNCVCFFENCEKTPRCCRHRLDLWKMFQLKFPTRWVKSSNSNIAPEKHLDNVLQELSEIVIDFWQGKKEVCKIPLTLPTHGLVDVVRMTEETLY